MVAASGIKNTDVLELSRRLVKVNRVYIPDASNKGVYERNYEVFKKLYRNNAESFKKMNSGGFRD